jgi:hypothetical protein
MARWMAKDHDGKWRRFFGEIETHSGFKGWGNKDHSAAFVMLDRWLCDAFKMPDRKSENGHCADGCKRANPDTPCICICGGENHGIDFEGIHHEIEEVVGRVGVAE